MGEFAMMTYTLLVLLCGVVIGWRMAIVAAVARAKSEVRTEVREVVQCRSCNKLRQAVEDSVNSANERMSVYHVPMITRGGVRRVDWAAMGCSEWAGNEPATRKKKK